MRMYILANYTARGVKGLLDGSNRETAVRTMMEAVGAKLESVQFTRGKYDVIVTADVPDHATGLGLNMAVRSSEGIADIVALEAIDYKAVLGAAQKAAKAYKPPA